VTRTGNWWQPKPDNDLGADFTVACVCVAVVSGRDACARRHRVSSRRASPAKAQAKPNPLKIPNSQIEPLAWHQIDGWMHDHHAEAFATFLASCKAILRSSAKTRASRPAAYNALYEVCGRAVAAVRLMTPVARAFFEKNSAPCGCRR